MGFLDDLFGPTLLGIIFNAWVVGAICLQAYHYYIDFPWDKMALKLLVPWTVLLQLFNLAVQSAMLYRYLVLSSEVVNGVLPVSWLWVLYLGLTTIAACTVQIFYAYRIFIMNGRTLFIPAMILLFSFTATGSCWVIVIKGLSTSEQFDQLEHAKWTFLLWLSCTGAADVPLQSSNSTTCSVTVGE
ncbi:hypothetical protein CPB84DRAFT_86409 [Gymnopilus junonius]|uniref:Uncharacterized protein n=1 Tax=Gymnopilus junonius TaxID=109634 RepID=A0A9P5P4V9_GYMJU|nr:hypothetical protein CPB84DRAFT_86409 [Gymnopilus junonius]